jgi:hypothetical protein
MRRALLALVPVAVSAAGAAAQPPAAHGPGGDWRWVAAPGDRRPLHVRIVRGSYRIVRREGPASVTMHVRSPEGTSDPVRFEVQYGERVTISDIYPARIRGMRECLPPQGERGDFWSSNAVIDAVIRAPESLEVEVDVMDQRPAARGMERRLP